MATLKQRLHRKNASGTYDTVHFETQSSMVLRPSGRTVEEDLEAYLPKVQSSDTVPQSLPAGRIVTGNSKVFAGTNTGTTELLTAVSSVPGALTRGDIIHSVNDLEDTGAYYRVGDNFEKVYEFPEIFDHLVCRADVITDVSVVFESDIVRTLDSSYTSTQSSKTIKYGDYIIILHYNRNTSVSTFRKFDIDCFNYKTKTLNIATYNNTGHYWTNTVEFYEDNGQIVIAMYNTSARTLYRYIYDIATNTITKLDDIAVTTNTSAIYYIRHDTNWLIYQSISTNNVLVRNITGTPEIKACPLSSRCYPNSTYYNGLMYYQTSSNTTHTIYSYNFDTDTSTMVCEITGRSMSGASNEPLVKHYVYPNRVISYWGYSTSSAYRYYPYFVDLDTGEYTYSGDEISSESARNLYNRRLGYGGSILDSYKEYIYFNNTSRPGADSSATYNTLYDSYIQTTSVFNSSKITSNAFSSMLVFYDPPTNIIHYIVVGEYLYASYTYNTTFSYITAKLGTTYYDNTLPLYVKR